MTENPSDHGVRAFTRWPGLLSLALGWVLSPTVALINQELIYSTNMWACGRNQPAAMHVVPALCLIVTIGVAMTAYKDWKAAGGGVEEEAADVATRTRWMGLVGVVVSVFSALVILAQWAAIFVFDPCMRA
ncbi:MAG TPA: hypothetical protein VN706_10935 [Gemmatimonadaceae bacterium]|nr:hypothetical protein [Gemmatimonadaceae bacterium]